MKLYTMLLIGLSLLVIDVEAQIGRLPLSPVQKLEQNIGMTDITIVYSRPSMRGRVIFGDLVPYDKIWRTGANRNTTIEFSKDVVIGDKVVKRGKYAIFSIPSASQWEVMLYADTDNWDVPEDFDESKVVAIIKAPSKQLIESQEVLSISIGDFTNHIMELNIAWEQTEIIIPIKLTNREIMDSRIADELKGPDYNDYYAAAQYQMEAGGDYKKGLTWINKAIEITDEVTWWDIRIKAILLMNLERKDEALSFAKEGLIMAQKAQREYGINEFNKLLEILEK